MKRIAFLFALLLALPAYATPTNPPLRVTGGIQVGTQDTSVYVTAYGAKGDGTTDDTTAILAAVTAWTANASGTLYFPAGTYKYTSAILFPMASNGRKAIAINTGATLNYTGTGYAIEALGSGESGANVTITGGRITGSAAGLGGIHLRAFSKATITSVQISGFTAGDGIYNEGANTVDIISCDLESNSNGYHGKSTTVSAVQYSPNAVRIIGGHVVANTLWGVFEDASGTGGTAVGNSYVATFETNGSGATGGNVFIQNAISDLVSGYFEYSAGSHGVYSITVGDGTNYPTGTVVRDSFFNSVSATSTIYDNGVGTLVEGCQETAAITSFLAGGANSSGRTLGKNRAASVGSILTGTDNSTLDIGNGAGLASSMMPSGGGVAFYHITGIAAPLNVQARSAADTQICNFLNELGAQKSYIDRATGGWNGPANITGGLKPSDATGAAQSGSVYQGSGVPSNANGNNGDIYFRTDTPGTANQRLYIKSAGSWTGIL